MHVYDYANLKEFEMNSLGLVVVAHPLDHASLAFACVKANESRLQPSEIKELMLKQCKLITDIKVIDFYAKNALE
jgi:hypothetical protein